MIASPVCGNNESKFSEKRHDLLVWQWHGMAPLEIFKIANVGQVRGN